MSGGLLPLVQRIQTALEAAGSMEQPALESLLESGEERGLLDRALRFLQGREALLIDVIQEHVHWRERVNQAVLRALSQEPLSLDELAARAGVSTPVVCDVVGWLEREGRVRLEPSDQVVLR